MTPSRVLLTIASSDDSTMAASRAWASSARLRSVTSRKTRTAPTGVAGLVPHRGGAVVDRPLRPVPGDEDGVVRQPDDRPLAQGPEGGVLDRLAGLLVDDVEDVRQRPAQRPRPGASRSGPRPRRSGT